MIDTDKALYRTETTAKFDMPLKQAITSFKVNPFGHRYLHKKTTITDLVRNGQFDRRTSLVTTLEGVFTFKELIDRDFIDLQQVFYDTRTAQFFTLNEAIQVCYRGYSFCCYY